MKKGLPLAIFLTGAVFAQDVVDIAPFWRAVDSVSLGNIINDLYTDLTLPDTIKLGGETFPITWESSDTLFLTHKGHINGRFVGINKEVTLTATVHDYLSEKTQKVTNKVSIHGYEPYSNYLFAYFPANDNENIYYALSNDGYNFTAMNGGKRVVAADTVSLKKGLRDPHVLRAPDGWFYMVNTDMKSSEGWASNRGMVLMKSKDLINWKHSTVHFPDRYKGKNFANVTRVWAPETFWDDSYDNGDGTKGRPLVYYSLLTNDGTIEYDQVFFNYANKDFTDLEGDPVHFFDRGKSTIDMDIVYNPIDKYYHAFYKNEGDGGICKVKAQTLTKENGTKAPSWFSQCKKALQQTTEAVEGAGVFKLINQNSWVLMYDCYMNGHYQFTSSADLESFKFVQDTKTSGAFTPRHGTILPITAQETAALMKAFPTDFEPKVIDIPDSIGVCDGKKVVAPCSGTKIIPYIKIGDGSWNESTDLKVTKGATLTLGPHPWDGKIWNWEGPNGFKSTDRENTLKNVDGDFSGYYTVTYTNETGCKSTAKIKIVVDDPAKPFKDTTGTTVIAKDYRDYSKPMRLNKAPVYFDMLGNRLKGKPRNAVYIQR